MFEPRYIQIPPRAGSLHDMSDLGNLKVLLFLPMKKSCIIAISRISILMIIFISSLDRLFTVSSILCAFSICLEFQSYQAIYPCFFWHVSIELPILENKQLFFQKNILLCKTWWCIGWLRYISQGYLHLCESNKHDWNSNWALRYHIQYR